MKKLSTLIMLSIFCFSALAQKNLELVAKQRPTDFEYLSATDSLGKRTVLKRPYRKQQTQQLKLPYPIIFIHGLNSNSDTWNTTTNFMDSQYALTFGGVFDYCLNDDLDNTTANTDFWPTAGADISYWTSANSIIAGDYYYVNFAVGSDGSFSPSSSSVYNVKSNQSAIAKQGAALSAAIFKVLQITGRDKVILMGHSMGGLASREYLQNPYNWQPDGHHHIAKLTTTGTPHGGSNATSFGIISGNTDGQSEAMRDLRTSYTYSGNSGVYLFGGVENLTYMEDQLLYYFYNSDVNCDGTGGTNQSIIGLNQKSIDTNIAYSCIIGECSSCPIGPGIPGDGVVKGFSADLHNYEPNLNPDIYYYTASSLVQIHTDLPSKYYENMQGLDEPNEYSQSYKINFDTSYIGLTTIQPIGGYPFDYDDYVFSVNGITSVNVTVNNITLSDLMVRIKDLNYNTIGTIIHSNGASSINFNQSLTAGDFYLEIYGTPTTTSYLHPYSFMLTNVTGVSELSKEKIISVYPNPSNDKIYFKNLEIKGKTMVTIENILGERIIETEIINNEMDIANLLPSLYIIKVENDLGLSVIRLVKR